MNRIYKLRNVTKRNIKGVFFNLSGTIIDNNSNSVKNSLYDAFNTSGVVLNDIELRHSMGNSSLTQIRDILFLPTVITKWKNRYKRNSNRGDALFILDLYKVKQIEYFKEGACNILLSKTLDIINLLKNKYNMKIGGTSSFTEEIVKYVLQSIGEQGLYFDEFCSSDQIIPRPCPDTLNILLTNFNISPGEFIKVGNTEVDMLEGKNAGGISVGLINSSSIMGECRENSNYYDHGVFDYESAFHHTIIKLARNGADFVIPDITYLPKIMDSTLR